MYSHLVGNIVCVLAGIASLHFGLSAFGYNVLNILGLGDFSTAVAAVAAVVGILSLLMFFGKLFGYGAHHNH